MGVGASWGPVGQAPVRISGLPAGPGWFRAPAWGWFRAPAKALRARCAAVCGDGALCQGGPDHRHTSTAAAEKFWTILHPSASGAASGGPAVDGVRSSGAQGSGSGPSPRQAVPLCAVWDPFHRVDAAAWRAIRSVPLAVRVFDTSKELDYLLAQGEGALFFRGARALLGGSESRSLRAPGGTRKIGHLSGTPGALLENYKVRGGVNNLRDGRRHPGSPFQGGLKTNWPPVCAGWRGVDKMEYTSPCRGLGKNEVDSSSGVGGAPWYRRMRRSVPESR